MSRLKHIAFVVFIGLFVSCASSPKFTSKETNPPSEVATEKKSKTRYEKQKEVSPPETNNKNPDVYYNLSTSLETVSGYASYYADDFDGKQTANGEIFNMYELTAAHKEYPFNTLIKVTNLLNNKTTIVRINDRGPFVEGRIIDLSLGAAKQLDMLGAGVQEVKLEIIEWGD